MSPVCFDPRSVRFPDGATPEDMQRLVLAWFEHTRLHQIEWMTDLQGVTTVVLRGTPDFGKPQPVHHPMKDVRGSRVTVEQPKQLPEGEPDGE